MDDLMHDIADLRRNCSDLLRSFRQIRHMMSVLVVLTIVLFMRVFGLL